MSLRSCSSWYYNVSVGLKSHTVSQISKDSNDTGLVGAGSI